MRFNIVGVPSPQGGMRAVQTARGARLITAGGVGLKSWRTAVADAAAAAALETGCFTCPVSVGVTFRFPMPKSAPKYDRDAGQRWRSRTPDVDKLLRGLFDGFTAGGLIADDSLIVTVLAGKIDVWQEWTGATVTIDEAVPL